MAIGEYVTMFYGAKPETFEKATYLRKNMTEAERILWDEIREKKIFDLKFRSQHPLDVYIVDFYCHSLKLVIEIDGGYHLNKEQKEYDISRVNDIKSWGITVIRFKNEDVKNNLEHVIMEIKDACRKLKAIR